MHLFSTIARFFLCLLPYLILVSNKDIIYHITGPITIPPFNRNTTSLIYWIAAMQFVRVFYDFFTKLYQDYVPASYQINPSKIWILRKMSLKYIIVIIMKMVLIFSQIHRMKYYLHVFFLQLFLMGLHILADIIQNNKVSHVLDIIAIDGINRVAIFYQLTRTFNPNFGLYFFGNNLLSLICYQLEGKRHQILYVKHDVYRIMVVTMGYLCLFSLLQCSMSYRPLIIFILTAYFFIESIKQFSHTPTVPEQLLEQKLEQNNSLSQGNDNQQQLMSLLGGRRRWNGRRNWMVRVSQGFAQREQQKERRVQSFKQYIKSFINNKALRYFLAVIMITIVMQLLFVYSQQSTLDHDKLSFNNDTTYEQNNQNQKLNITMNRFLEYLRTMQIQALNNGNYSIQSNDLLNEALAL